MKHALLLAAAAAVAAGCGPAGKSTRNLKPDAQAPAEAWRGVATVAVLPPNSWTDHGLEYVAWYRAVIAESLRQKRYNVVPLVQVNRFMIDRKFHLSGELGMFETKELADAFRADALLSWQITNDGPVLEVVLQKADGTILWATGEVRLGTKFKWYTSGQYHGQDDEFALALTEILRRLPERS